jgi:hypothetical protein
MRPLLAVFGSIFFTATAFVFFFIPEVGHYDKGAVDHFTYTPHLHSWAKQTKGLPLEAMDHLFGVAELTDAEKAVMGYGEEKPTVLTDHIEYRGTTSNQTARPEGMKEVDVMGTIQEVEKNA